MTLSSLSLRVRVFSTAIQIVSVSWISLVTSIFKDDHWIHVVYNYFLVAGQRCILAYNLQRLYDINLQVCLVAQLVNLFPGNTS